MDRTPGQKQAEFVFPRILGEEMGEIERVARYVGEPREQFVTRFLRATLPKEKRANFTDLTEDIWKQLQNTDSPTIEMGRWDQVEGVIGENRDWKLLRKKMENGERIDAPIVAKLPNEYHVVSGNTRLVVARALGLTPKVLIVDLT